MLARIQGESAATAKPPRGQREVAVRLRSGSSRSIPAEEWIPDLVKLVVQAR